MMYVILDGYSQGIGILLLFAHSQHERCMMMRSFTHLGWQSNLASFWYCSIIWCFSTSILNAHANTLFTNHDTVIAILFMLHLSIE